MRNTQVTRNTLLCRGGHLGRDPAPRGNADVQDDHRGQQGIGTDARRTDNAVKQKIIRKHRGENLAIVVPIMVRDGLPIEPDLPARGRI